MKQSQWIPICVTAAALWLLAMEPLQAQAVRFLEHFPVTRAQAGKSVPIRVRLQSTSMSPVYVRVYFKSIQDRSYRHRDLRGRMDVYEGEIPAKYVRPPALQYFLVALYPNRKVVSLPELNPYGSPYEVQVEEGKAPEAAPAETAPSAADSLRGERARAAASSADIQILSPEPLEEVAPDEVVIAVSFLNEGGADSSSVHVTIDGNEVTRFGEVSEYVATVAPPQVLPGKHTVAVWGNNSAGESLQPVSWTFTVLPPEQALAEAGEKSYEGRVFAEYRHEKFSGATLNTRNLGGNIDGKAGPFTYSGQVLVTSLEDPRFQPRNRFSFLAESKTLDLGFGDLYPYFNDLVLWGRRVRGVLGALKLGFINFQVVTGTTARLIKPLYLSPGGGAPPTLIQKGSFKQNLFAGRVSFGRGENFQFGLMALKAKDDLSSLKPTESISTPKDNLVAGADFLLAFDSHRFELKASAAYSLLTNDITNGPASKATIDSTFDVNLPFDPADFEKILVLNESTIPLDPTGLTSLAYQVSLNLNYFGHFLQIGYKRLGPEYNTFGHTYLRSNIRGFFVDDRIALFNNKVYASVGFEDFKDNFGQEDDNPAVTLRTVNLGLSYYPGPHLPTITFSMKNYLRDNGIDQFSTQVSPLGTVDTTDTREQSLTRDISLNISYDFNALNLKHNATVSVVNSRLIDHFSSDRPTTVGAQDVLTTLQMVSLRSEFQRPLTTTLTFATNRNEATGGRSTIQFDLFTGRADYRLLNDQLTVYGGLRYVAASGAQLTTTLLTVAKVDYKQTGLLFGASYQPGQHHNFMLDVELIDYKDNGTTLDPATGTMTPNPSYKNRVVRLFYEYRL